ncbi:MAG: flagellar hook-length control protein FliK, partial [Colwellia sp.]|nr:flagellar hook-length control protein FliK [Colwellia sp.]
KITNVSSDKISGDKTNIAQQMSNNTLPSEAAVDRDLVSKNIEHTSLTADQKIAKQIKSEHAQLSIEKTSTNAQSDNQNQTKYDAVKSLENAVDTIKQQINSSKPIQNGKVSSVSEPQLTNSELTQSSEITKANEKTNQATAQLNKTVLPSNQPTTSNLNHDDANKTQAKQDEKAQLSAAFAEQSQQKSAAQNGGEVFVEGKPIASVKIEPPANGHFIDVSGKATQTPQHIIEQQSAEMLSPSVATEVTQGQKTNTQLHQETISMFRKDFTEAVKDKVMLMISQKLQQFDITLDPPELGNMQVRVNLQGEQAVVSFLVQSQQTKDALEQNMHKLRELLAEQGVDVGDANVEQQSQQSTNEEGSTAGNNNQMEGEIDNMADANDVVAHTLSAQMIDSSTASVDYYA